MGKSAATRARLQREALRLFADRGYDETTIADIAAAAGVTQMTDPLNNRQISRLDGHRLSDGRIIRIIHNHQLLGRKVPEERHLRNPGWSGDIRNRRLVVAAIGEQPQRFSLEPRPGSR